MRKSEILTLRWNQVNLKQRFLLLLDTKNGEQRGVPLTETVVGLLREIQAEQAGLSSPWVFPNPMTGKPYRHDIKTAWYTALKKTEITDFHFHDLRHTCASYLRMQGVDLLTIAEILGHKDLKMTKRYAHVAPTHRLAAIGLLENVYNQGTASENDHRVAADATAALDWQQKRQQVPETPLLVAS
jgi:integrase